MTTASTHISPVGPVCRLLCLVLSVAVAVGAGSARSAHASAKSTLPPYGWPVKPFDKPHPVRGSFGDPRTVFTGPPSRRTLLSGEGSFSFHFGIDVSAPNGTAVYPVESGTVTIVSSGKGREYVEVAGGNGRSFQYWHLAANVAPGTRAERGVTVLGHILRPCGHVHLAELDHGVIVNPLAPGRLTPYADTTTPAVTAVSFRRTVAGPALDPLHLRGRVEILAAARDFPSVPVPGAWNGLPVTPALLSWSVRSATTGRIVVPEQVAYDVRDRLPAASAFWTIYARGTHQNMTTFGKVYSYRQPGAYLFRLAPAGLDTSSLRTGAYRLVVTARDVRGNESSFARDFRIGR